MKTRHIIYTMALALGLAVTSCDDDLAMPPVPVPEGGIESIGTGAWDKPMSAYQALIGSENTEYNPAWVCGYIVGYCNVDVSNVMSATSAALQPESCTVNTNILIAMDPLETDWEKCATVQLPSGAARDALNLASHPDNLGKQVCVLGTTGSKYCGAYGVRSVSDYNWGDKGIQTEPDGPVEALPYLWQNWESSDKISSYLAQGWQNVEVSGGLSGWYIREFSGQNYITVSAYLGNANGGPYENWLISPPVDLTKSNSRTLTFETEAAYPAENSTLEVYAMDGPDPATANKIRLDAKIAEAPSKGYSAWVKSGVIDLSGEQYVGVVYIGWRYRSEAGGDGGSTTYCLDNVNIGGAPEEDNPPVPEEGVVYSGLDPEATSIDWTFDNVKLGEGLSYVWSWKDYKGKYYLNGNAFAGGAREALSYAVSPVIDLTGKTQVKAVFEHAAKFQTVLQELCGFVVRVEGETAWTDLKIPTWPKAGDWTFVSSGDIDLSAYAGKKIRVAFKYGSTDEKADTWEIRSLVITGK